MHTRNDRQKGSAIVTVLGVISVVVIMCGLLGFTAAQQMRNSQVTRDLLKARVIAESGINAAYHAVKTDFAKAKGYSAQAAFGDGTYAVRSVPLANDGGGTRALFVSQGLCGLGRSVVSADLTNRNKNGSGYLDLGYDILAGSTLTMSGYLGAGLTKIHANGTLKKSGPYACVGTTATSTGLVTWDSAVGLTLLSYQPAVPVFTDALKKAIDALIAEAVKNGAVYATSAAIPAAPPGGVAYCTETLAKNWIRTGTGCFIFAGTVDLGGKGVNIASANGYPALIVTSASEFKSTQVSVFHGAVLIPNGKLTLSNNNSIYGPVVVGQAMTCSGAAVYAGDNGLGFNVPGGGPDNVVVSAWH